MEEEFSMEGSVSVYHLKMMTIQETHLLGKVDSAAVQPPGQQDKTSVRPHARGVGLVCTLSLPPSGV